MDGYRTAIGQTASFRGLGGLGKTQLAVEYAHTFRDHYPNGVIWLNADQGIDAQLIEIAERAKWVAADSDPKDKLAIAKQRLRTHSHCLIVLDNVEEMSAVREYLPEPDAQPHILVTSRLDHADFVPVPLDLLGPEVSLQLLVQEAGRSPKNEEEWRAAKEIAQKLGGLPLAIELAGAYLRHRPVEWQRYRDLLNQNLRAAMPGKFLGGSFTRHEADLYSTLRIGDEILAEEPLLREIVDVLTWSGPSAMGGSLLCAILALKDLSSAAGALSLGVELRLLQKTPGVESYALHRLVREVRRESTPLASRESWVIEISERLSDWFQSLKRDFSDLQKFDSEIEHLQAWEGNVERIAPKLASRLIWLQAYPSFHRGRYDDALTWLEKSNAYLKPGVEGDEELRANLLTDLCTIYTILGRYVDAKKSGEEALAIRVKLLGENGPDTAMSFHNLGAVLRLSGEVEASLLHDQKAFSIWHGLHGEDHIDTALALDGISGSYAALGRKQEALEFAERALRIREKTLGRLHPDTAHSLSNVGCVYADLGQYDRALVCEEKALAIADELFGAKSPIKATVLMNIANIYFQTGNFVNGLTNGLRALEMRRDLFGNYHPETLNVVVGLAGTCCKQGYAHKGIQLIDDQLTKMSAGHPEYEMLRRRSNELKSLFPRPGFRQLRKERK